MEGEGGKGEIGGSKPLGGGGGGAHVIVGILAWQAHCAAPCSQMTITLRLHSTIHAAQL